MAAPNGSETWEAGKKQTISWNYTGSPGSYVKIELLKGGVVDRVISSSRPITSGKYQWTIPSTLASGDDYSVRVTSRSNSSYTDTSDATFTIVGPPAPSITVAAPNGSETWAAGTKQTISWNYNGSPGSYVKIELLKGGVFNRLISSSRPITSGKYQWTIPSTLASGDDYSVRVTSRSNSSYTDSSDASFTITEVSDQ
ncbi:MAG: Ser-Thr-rich glycosyl-phosphatidyl-inositol-anchored membrane family protein [Pelotomaculum sp. PtaB.Bin104]|nr:MAG: Ser-Thr-rich glycosyl-phosphatidyl-inositol-anchored membrane family protein [Pelotomaculum sp. PtaB.Bin104]